MSWDSVYLEDYDCIPVLSYHGIISIKIDWFKKSESWPLITFIFKKKLTDNKFVITDNIVFWIVDWNKSPREHHGTEIGPDF